ncbi:MAG: helix-turn-helix transcriptional regulator [Pseudomonadota bacterium]
MRRTSLGEFEILVLAALLRCGDEAYGAAIREEIKSRAGRDATVGAIYTTLARMQEKGLVTSKLGPASAERGGRPKRFFRLTARGRKAFDASVDSLRSMLDGLDAVPESRS